MTIRTLVEKDFPLLTEQQKEAMRSKLSTVGNEVLQAMLGNARDLNQVLEGIATDCAARPTGISAQEMVNQLHAICQELGAKGDDPKIAIKKHIAETRAQREADFQIMYNHSVNPSINPDTIVMNVVKGRI